MSTSHTASDVNDPEHAEPHIVGPGQYTIVWVSLLFLTGGDGWGGAVGAGRLQPDRCGWHCVCEGDDCRSLLYARGLQLATGEVHLLRGIFHVSGADHDVVERLHQPGVGALVEDSSVKQSEASQVLAFSVSSRQSWLRRGGIHGAHPIGRIRPPVLLTETHDHHQQQLTALPKEIAELVTGGCGCGAAGSLRKAASASFIGCSGRSGPWTIRRLMWRWRLGTG